MQIRKHLDKENMHHAYLIEGVAEKVLPEVFDFLKELGVKTTNNPDFCLINTDSFKVEDARNLRSMGHEKGLSEKKKIYVVTANTFLLEAQNTLLKMFEEPAENTYFFIITPDLNKLLKTLVSRFYVIKTEITLEEELKQAEKFLKMKKKDRIDFMKELTKKINEDDEEENKEILKNPARLRSLKFLNALEFTLHERLLREDKKIKETKLDFFSNIMKAREFVMEPGSSLKSLMESVSLTVPEF